MMADDIREDDLLRAIQEAMEKPELDDLPRWEPGTISSGYLRYHYGLTEHAALKILRELKKMNIHLSIATGEEIDNKEID